MTQQLVDFALREYRSARALGVSDPHSRSLAVTNAARQFQVTRALVRQLLNAALTARHTGVEIL